MKLELLTGIAVVVQIICAFWLIFNPNPSNHEIMLMMNMIFWNVVFLPFQNRNKS